MRNPEVDSEMLLGPIKRAALSRIGRFTVQSVLSFALSLGIPLLLVELAGMQPSIAVLLAILFVFFTNFSVCRWYVFRATSRPIATQFVAFAASSAGFRAAEYVGFLLMSAVLGFPYLPVLACVIGASFFAKFSFYSANVFR